MTKHFCDICGKQLIQSKDATEISMGRKFSPNAHLIYQEVCDECTLKVVEAINNEVDKIRKENNIYGTNN